MDDQKIIAETLAIIMRLNGFDVKFFTDPTEAFCDARSEPLDLLLSDVMMPQLSGIDLAIAILKIRPECKVLLFSGQAGHQANRLNLAFAILVAL